MQTSVSLEISCAGRHAQPVLSALTCDNGSIAELEPGVWTGAAGRATSGLLPAAAALPVPAMAVVWVPASPASSASVSLSFPLLLSLSAALVEVFRDSLEGLFVPGLRGWDCGVVEAWLRVFAADA